MPYDDVQKFSEAAVNKAKLLKEHPGKYFLRAVMAGFFIVVAMIFSNVVGNTFRVQILPGENCLAVLCLPLRFC